MDNVEIVELTPQAKKFQKRINRIIQKEEERYNVRIIVLYKPSEMPKIRTLFVIGVNSHL
jgi:hypothetical protein